MSIRLKSLAKSAPPVVWMLLALILIFSFTVPNYFSFTNLSNILIQSAPLMILAFAQTLIILTQGTDLSLGAQVSFTTVIWVFMAKAGIPIYLAAPLAVGCTVLIGTINGILVAKGNIPPFIATLGMQNIVNSISLLLTAGSSIYFSHYIFQFVTEARFLFLPPTVWAAILIFGITWTLLRKTAFGTNIIGLGGNKEALTLAGINIDFALIKTYAYAGLIAGVTGLLVACRVESGQPSVANGWEFDAVAAALLGGTSLREGRGSVVGTIFGVFMITLLKNGLNVAGVSTLYQNALIGSIVLSAIVVDAIVRRIGKE